ncbi:MULTISPECIES: hypothetical protein [unclassified Paenibacillus]|uniref:hypothetical protein n=1 Tax=unclassified Paenibacillus TaxID=185978 RepID=UPI0024761F38|nr:MULTISPECIES: hypothetical protein [unclassified Paenibacillus]MDH6429050.1 hypothetical protein [Paenibacillus sp. PastH-4]MDH6445255.1 hypothetical protein [Paenibacillus sp. PastF-4]MDH6529145.1 hypothetical protein [Paenibacillus sp. PastH-3]
MYLIQTKNDISFLTDRFSNSKTLIVYISQYFQHLQSELCNDKDDTFTINQHNPIIVLEPGDDLHNLSYAGLHNDDLLTRSFEFVEIYDLGDIEVYRMVLMLDNDFLVTFFAVVGTLDEEAEQWLNEIAVRY